MIDGTYPNATIVVVGGCIVQVEPGEAMAYQPDVCCPAGGGGGGEDGLMGPPGPAGTPATVTVGTVTSVAPTDPPTVVNVGTPSNAILDFEIPSGAPGADAPNVTGVTAEVGAWELENGLAKSIPPDFPPIGTLLFGASDVVGLNLVITKNPTSGQTTIDIDGDAFYSSILASIAVVQADVAALAGEAAWGGITGALSAQTDLWGQLQIRPRWTYAAVAPASPTMGERWWNSTTNVESVWIDDGVNPPAWLPV